MRSKIEPDNRCTGCNVCISSCPKDAIVSKINELGFWYPQVDSSLCVDCGICKDKCPVYGEKVNNCFDEPVAYAGWNRDENVRKKSSSGGIFTAIAELVINNKGVVYGAAYTKEFSVEHIRVETIEDISKVRGSKYVQSYISTEIYRNIEKDLRTGREVLFSGTPCQTAAVNSRFGNYKNLLTVDVICHGVPSPYAWQKYLSEISRIGKIENINMRDKSHGWNNMHMSVLVGSRKLDNWFNDSLWGKSFLANLFLRNSCYSCEFKEYKRCSDVSLGDFWDAVRGTHMEYDDDDKGTSVVLVNSDKGHHILSELKNCYLDNILYEWIPEKTYAVVKSSTVNPNREKAFELLKKGIDFSKVLEKCTQQSFFSKCGHKIKGWLKKCVQKRL